MARSGESAAPVATYVEPDMRRSILVGLVAAGALLAQAGSALASSHAHPAARPTISSIAVSQKSAPASGARVFVTVVVHGGKWCTFRRQVAPFSALHLVRTVSCAIGWARVPMAPVVNQHLTSIKLMYSVTATSSRGYATVRRIGIVEEAAVPPPAPTAPPAPDPLPDAPPAPPATTPVPTSSVVGLDTCDAGPDCDYGPIDNTYPDYDNVGVDGINDCTFASAADWEQIVHGLDPDPAEIENEFHEAGGSDQEGITALAFFTYWSQQGINGVHLTGVNDYSTDQADVESEVRADGAVLAAFTFNGTQTFGPYVPQAGSHMAVVDGFTPAGPLIVTWGQTLQVSWDDWNASAIAMWGVGTTLG
jgi:hypothetical protein